VGCATLLPIVCYPLVWMLRRIRRVRMAHLALLATLIVLILTACICGKSAAKHDDTRPGRAGVSHVAEDADE